MNKVHYGVQQDRLKLTPKGLKLLSELGQISNNLYNQCTYAYRQHYFVNGNNSNKLISKPEIHFMLHEFENAKLMHSQAAQATSDSVYEAFKSFKALHKLHLKGELHFVPKLPKYREKGGTYQVVYPSQSIKVKDGYYVIPLGRSGEKHFGQKNFRIPIPKRMLEQRLRELRFVPRHKEWMAEYVYVNPEVPIKEKSAKHSHVLGIDIGIDNALTCISNQGAGFIICGRKLKSLNQRFNKFKAKLQSLLPKKQHWSKQLSKLTLKRSFQMRDWVNKTARELINYCQSVGIDTIVIGHNKMQKQEVNIGKKNNQNFNFIPHFKLRRRIAQLCELKSIHYIETEESYTSKSSFLDNDQLPSFGAKPERWQFSGNRVKRGLFRTAEGYLINADCNGAANILRKVSTKLKLDLSGVSRGTLTAPFRCTMDERSNRFGLVDLVNSTHQ